MAASCRMADPGPQVMAALVFGVQLFVVGSTSLAIAAVLQHDSTSKGMRE